MKRAYFQTWEVADDFVLTLYARGFGVIMKRLKDGWRVEWKVDPYASYTWGRL